MQTERLIQNLQEKYKGSKIAKAVFCLVILSIAKNGVLRSPTILVDSSISPFNLLVTSTASHCLLNSCCCSVGTESQLTTGLCRHYPDVEIRAGNGRSGSHSALMTGWGTGAHSLFLWGWRGGCGFSIGVWMEQGRYGQKCFLLLGHPFPHSLTRRKRVICYLFVRFWGAFCLCLLVLLGQRFLQLPVQDI